MEKISAFIADDHAVVREGIRALLEVQDDIEVAGRPPTDSHPGQPLKGLVTLLWYYFVSSLEGAKG